MNNLDSIKIGRLNRFLTYLSVLMRPALFLSFQGLFVLLFICLKTDHPTLSVTNWWTVYGTLVDAGCILIILYLLRKEGKGLRLLDLMNLNREKTSADILIGLGIVLLVFPVCIGLGSVIGGISVYGTLKPNIPPGNPMTRSLPFWAAIYSKTIWWIFNGFVEELLYQGYALTRIQVMFRKTTPAVLWVGFAWSLQHSFLPFINLQYALYAFLLFFPLAIALQLIFLRVKRLLPLIIGHWGMDCISAIFLIAIA